MEEYKTCTKCSQIQPLSNFHKKKNGKFGVSSVCKTCTAIISADWRAKNPERKKQNDRNWQLKNPDKKRESQRRWERANAEAERARKAADYQANKVRRDQQSKAWDKANPEKRRARKRNWRRNNPEKVREQYLKDAIRNKQNGIFLVLKKEMRKLTTASHCFYCGEKSRSLTIDHVLPRVRGGRHSIGNLVAACGPCNFSKGGKTIMEWRVWKLRLDSDA